MKRPLRLVASFVMGQAVAACNGGAFNVPGTPAQATSPAMRRAIVPEWELTGRAKPACPQVVGQPTCLAIIQSTGSVSPAVAGWEPTDFQKRYNLPSSTNGKGQIVAIVDAYDNPNVASDLAIYRKRFKLGKANFLKYNQHGKQRNYPHGSPGWGFEIDGDVEMVSAACPLCTIYLVEANSSNSSDLDAAEVEAVNLGAHIVSNSWICYGSVACVDASAFDRPGVVYTAGSGDLGYDEDGAPEALASVVSIGGTVLFKNGSTYGESIWYGTGAGCAAGVPKPSWQHDPDCSYRTTADVSAVAWDVAEYDSYNYGGWFTVGGTSVATPITAAVFALAGNASTQNAGKRFWSLPNGRRHRFLNYISSGSDGSCNGEYLCNAGTKQFHTYSGPGGWGTPDGVRAY